MAYYVCKGAKLKCSMGSGQSELDVFHPAKAVNLCGKAMAGIMDSKPMANIKPFGKCRSLANHAVAAATAANYGRLQEMPCIPNTPSTWLGGKINLIIKGSPALLDTSRCMCMWAGVIEITYAGQGTVKEGGPMNVSIRADSPSGAPPLQASGIGSSLAPQNAAPLNAAASVSPRSTLSVKKVEGAAETYPRQKIAYKAEYSKSISEMSDEEKSKAIRWSVEAGNAAERFMFEGGEKITLDIDKDWEGKDILVIARIENTEKASFKTKVLQDASKSTLIRGVVGEDEAFTGQEIKYEATNSNKDGDAGKVDGNGDIKWAIKAGKDGIIDKKLLECEKGKRIISLGMKDEWAGKEIVVMPYLNSPTETVSVKTRVYISLGAKIKEMQSSSKVEDTYSHSNLFIEKLIKDMRVYGMATGWLEKVSNSSIELGKQIEIDGKIFDGIAFAKNNNVVINVSNNIFREEPGRDNKVLQAIVLHELVHVWQAKTGKASTDIEKRFGNKMNDGGSRNIYTEVEAYNIQFEFEGKTKVPVNARLTNEIRSRFFASYSEFLASETLTVAQTEERKANYLLGGIFKNRGFERPTTAEL
jgi:hypothetical protein